jgi:hypothetical protein
VEALPAFSVAPAKVMLCDVPAGLRLAPVIGLLMILRHRSMLRADRSDLP